MVAKASDDSFIDVCTFCVNYLYENYSNEKNLFRSGVSLTDVRTLQSQLLYPNNNKAKEDYDPHLIAEVLLTCFRDMKLPLLLEAYEDILGTELNEDNFDVSRDNIQNWAVKLDENKFQLTSNLFRLLSKLASLDDNESSLLQLSFTISPTICRPTTSAYMSIRHLEDLKKIRPVMSFIIENYDDIFYGLSSSKAAVVSPSMDRISNMMSTSMIVDPVAVKREDLSSSSNDSADGLSSFDLLRSSLMVVIPSSIGGGDVSVDLEGKHPEAFSDQEWNILDALVFNHVSMFVDYDDAFLRRIPSFEISAQNSPKLSFSQSLGGSINFGKTLPAIQADSRMGKRRKMVADCKGMRAQIFEFEQDWTRKHNRIPKTYERGAMQSVYAKYRELKKDIRNLAALDLQRTARGFIARCRLRGPSTKAKPSWAATATHGSGSGHTHGSTSSTAAGRGGSSVHHKSVDDMITATNSSHHQPLSHFAESHKAAAATLQHQLQHQPAVLSGSGGGSTSHPEGTPLGDLYGRYRELLNSKRELKRKLKKFDEDFVEQWGRLPKKADKEVIRPMYQKYHEVKNSLDELKAQIELSHGPLPEDLLEDGKHGGSGGSSKSEADVESEAMDVGSAKSKGNGNSTKYLSSDDDDNKPLSAHRQSRHDDKHQLHQDHKIGGSAAAAGSKHSSAGGKLAIQEPVDASRLDGLLVEKANLHAYLKVYERDFNRQHGRPVMKQEDIQPVAHEYQRYKELKSLIKEAKRL